MTSPGFRGLDTPPPDTLSDHTKYLRSIRDVVNNLLTGKMNVTIDVSLTPSSATTVIQDSRIGGNSHINIGSPLTANAAAAMPTTYVSSIGNKTATLTHTSNAQTDRTFRIAIIG